MKRADSVLDFIASCALILLLVGDARALNNGLALTPPMGWLTWQRFRCNIDCDNDPTNCISERLIREQAEMMVKDGYVRAGYEYIIIDDCWLAKTRDSNNRLQPDAKRFPSGIRALADYVHSLGLKFGIYEDYGVRTCAGYPGSIDHMKLDAQTFADWTVDYVKFDGCNSSPDTMGVGYPLMSHYLKETKRPMVFSCEWPLYQYNVHIKPDYKRIAEYCNMWRSHGDIQDSFDSMQEIIEWHAKQQDELAAVQGPGAWNDPDMLLVGNFGLSYGQSQAQMALWSIMAVPLIMSVDLRTIEPGFRDILQNKNLLAINQDKLGVMGKRFVAFGNVQGWSKKLANGYTAFVLFNPSPDGTPTTVLTTMKQLGLSQHPAYNLYETFTGELIGNYKNSSPFNATVNPSGSVFAFWAEPTSQSARRARRVSSLIV